MCFLVDYQSCALVTKTVVTLTQRDGTESMAVAAKTGTFVGQKVRDLIVCMPSFSFKTTAHSGMWMVAMVMD